MFYIKVRLKSIIFWDILYKKKVLCVIVVLNYLVVRYYIISVYIKIFIKGVVVIEFYVRVCVFFM